MGEYLYNGSVNEKINSINFLPKIYDFKNSGFFCTRKLHNLQTKKKKIRLNVNSSKLSIVKCKNCFDFTSLLNIIELGSLLKTVFYTISSFVRSLTSICVFHKLFPFIFINSFILSSEQVLPSLVKKNNCLIFIESTSENIEHVRNNFINTIMSILKNEKLLIKIRNKLPIVLIVIPNQTVLIQIVRKIYNVTNNIDFRENFSTNKNFKNNSFLHIKNGKLIEPADRRASFSDGSQDCLEIGASLENNTFRFGVRFETSDIAFLSPLAICRFTSKKKNRCFSKLKYCFFEDLSKLAMQNSENFLNVLKQLVLYNKSVDLNLEKNSLQLSANRYSIQFLVTSNLIYNRFPGILYNITNNGFCFFYQFDSGRLIHRLNEANHRLLKIKTKKNQKISNRRIEIFIHEILPHIKINSNTRLLIFFHSYSEYVLVRNFIWKFNNNKNICVLALNEYTDLTKKLPVKNIFQIEKPNVILITERFYFFKRYFIKNLSDIVFFSFPMNWEFYFEISSILNPNCSTSKIYSILHISDFDNIEKIYGFQKTQEIFSDDFF
nr:U3 small nucleolar RNA-associated protein 25 isoform [Cryptomonas sp.]